MAVGTDSSVQYDLAVFTVQTNVDFKGKYKAKHFSVEKH